MRPSARWRLLRSDAAVVVAGGRLGLAGLGRAVLAECARRVERDAVLHRGAGLLGTGGGFFRAVLDPLTGRLSPVFPRAAGVLARFLCFLASLFRVFGRCRLLRENGGGRNSQRENARGS